MKKVIALSLVLTVVFSLFQPYTVKAKNTSEITKIYEANDDYVAKNLEKLLKNGTPTTSPSKVVTNKSLNLSSVENSFSSDAINSYDVQTYIIQNEELTDTEGDSTGVYALTTASTISTGNTNVSGYDETLAVKCYSTIYYNIKADASGIDHYCLKKISGGYTKSDKSTVLVSQNIAYGETGPSSFASGGSYSVYDNYSPSSTTTSWSKSTGYTEYIARVGYYSFGATYSVKLTKGSSTWTFYQYNNL